MSLIANFTSVDTIFALAQSKFIVQNLPCIPDLT